MQVQEGWFLSYELMDMRYRELIISMAKCKELAFVILARN